MKNMIITLCLFLSACTFSFSQTAEASKKEQTTETIYFCPQHNTVLSDKEGKCSECGMKLVEGEKVYECEKCHAISKTPGNCPNDCGKKTEKIIEKNVL